MTISTSGRQMAGKLVPELRRPERPMTDPVKRSKAPARGRDRTLSLAPSLLGCHAAEQVVKPCAHRSGSRRVDLRNRQLTLAADAAQH